MAFPGSNETQMAVHGDCESVIIPTTYDAANRLVLRREDLERIVALEGKFVCVEFPPQPMTSMDGTTKKPVLFADERIKIDPNRVAFQIDGRTERLSPIEFKLMYFLASHAPNAVAREDVYDTLWPQGYVTPRSLDVHIRRLRKRLGPNLGHSEHGAIRTVRKYGYRAVQDLIEI